MSGQLVNTVEQVRNCERQVQLGNNQKKKTELVLAEVQKNTGSTGMYRSLGRMFVLCGKDELSADLNADMARIQAE